jgi:hypothetical protein
LGGIILLNPYDFYITPDEYEEAAENGINQRCLEYRIRYLAWRKRSAITKPKMIRLDRTHMKAILIQHGITYAQFRNRIKLGWNEWDAATVPIRDRSAILEQCNWMTTLCRKFPLEVLELAKANGIPYRTFISRLNNKWPYELASTLPPSKSHGFITQKLMTIYGDYYHQHLSDRSYFKIKNISTILSELHLPIEPTNKL